MRRYNPPFNGMQYVLNTSTGEIHDLDNEKANCQIDEINTKHVYNCESYEHAQMHAIMVDQKNPNGCHYCMPEKDNG